MRELRAWLSSWATTLRIMVFERGTYRALREPFDPGGYTEATRPGQEDPA